MHDAEVPIDEYLKTYADRYESWRKGGAFTYSSKVIPARESFRPRQWILPREQVLQVLKDARSFALTDCDCRTHYARCDKPRDVCFLIDEASDKAVERGKARRISLADAAVVLQKSDKHGLVNLTLFMPGHRIYALCSCCACCCHDLQLLKKFHRTDLVARSDYVSVTDTIACTGCGLCIDRCVFDARRMQENRMKFDAGACLGCGLCVSACPEHAVTLNMR